MKTLQQLLLALIVILISNSAQSSNTDSSDVLTVRGKILHKGVAQSATTVTLYEDNIPVEDIETSLTGKFNVTLKRGRQYMLAIEKEGLQNRLISVNTKMPDDDDDYETVFGFDFELEMIPKTTKFLNHDAYDFPCALIGFSSHHESFKSYEEYTASIMEEINKLMALEHREPEQKNKVVKKVNSHIEYANAATIQSLITGE